MKLPFVVLLLLQAAFFALGNVPQRRDMDLDGYLAEGEEEVRRIMNKPYNPIRNDGSNTNDPFNKVNYKEKEKYWQVQGIRRSVNVNLGAPRFDDEETKLATGSVVDKVHSSAREDNEKINGPFGKTRYKGSDILWDKRSINIKLHKPRPDAGRSGIVEDPTTAKRAVGDVKFRSDLKDVDEREIANKGFNLDPIDYGAYQPSSRRRAVGDVDFGHDIEGPEGKEIVNRAYEGGAFGYEVEYKPNPETRNVDDDPWLEAEDEPRRPTLETGRKRAVPEVIEADAQKEAGKKALDDVTSVFKGLIGGLAAPTVWYQSNPRGKRADRQGHLSSWSCNRVGTRDTKGALSIISKVFDDLFGKSPLVGQFNQCYVATCQKWFFAWCQMSLDDFVENVGAREIVANRDPGKGGACFTALDGPGFNEYHRYFWGHEGATKPPQYGRQDVRKCR